ncbi:MAG: amidohydrolase family protein [Candidatus Fibromonas sp.]|jgi:predicted TIM-barrel fold metal-dependent hydrolase|nr:amidohydrolase family protein [Candidatus Fibromonas sp.]
MIFDIHVHVGQFEKRYFSPEFVCGILQKAGITHFAFSSFSHIASKDRAFLLAEREKVLELSQNRAVVFQWVMPEMLGKRGGLESWLDKNVRGLKVHGKAQTWLPFGKPLQKVFAIAAERSLPVMLHTGEDKGFRPDDYLRICQKFPQVKVILAHGRPLDSAIFMLKECPNTFVDTAFMPNGDIEILLELGFGKRVLFGTDVPAQTLFYKSSVTQYVKRRIEAAKKMGLNLKLPTVINSKKGSPRCE